MGQLKVYLKPFDDYGNYQTDWTDITKFVSNDSIGDIKTSLDGSEFQLGIFTNANITLSVNNIGGEFSDIDQSQSLFKYRRGDSQVKITWSGGDWPECGIAILGECGLFEEIEIFKGLIQDETISSDIEKQNSKLVVMGIESIFSKVIVPFGTVSVGDLVSDVLFNLLNQTIITNLLTVSSINITAGIDQAIDSIASLQNKTVKEGLETLLNCSNSVLYIKDDVVYTGPRTATVAVEANFYGQNSTSGVENISDIEGFTNGAPRVFNFIRWSNTTNSVTDNDSTLRFGLRKKELGYEIFTNGTKISNILNSILSEFSTAKQEFDITVPLNYQNLNLKLLDRIIVDYPTNYIISEGSTLPICGIAEWGSAILPFALLAIVIDSDDNYKIIAKSLSLKNQTITFRARKI